MKKIVEMAGKQCERLLVIEKHHRDKNGGWHWLCLCSCGKETIVNGRDLRNGHTKSCGCLIREVTGNINRSHGLSKSRIYKIWAGTIQRCHNPKNSDYKCYGERGIVVCNEWKNNFESFNEWAMSSGYTEDLTLERIDVNGNYCPENCEWILLSKQARNTRKNKLVTYKGKTQCVAAWEEELGFNCHTLWNRLYTLKWSEEQAFTQPVKKRKRRKDK